jgi:hypothetical protein
MPHLNLPRVVAPLSLLMSVALGAAVLTTATTSRADGEATTSWWIEARPWTCSDHVAPLARQVELACDASGRRCRIAEERKEAERIAVIACSADRDAWRLDAEDRAGHTLWSVTLTGDEDARIRKGAMWIARAESEGPPSTPPEPAVKVQPPPVPAVPEPPPPSPVVVVAAPPEKPAPAEAPAERAATPRWLPALNVSLLAGAPLHDRTAQGEPHTLVGARVAAAVHLSESIFFGATVNGETFTEDKNPDTYAHLGALLAVGAPYTHDWLGVSAEGGTSLLMRYDARMRRYDDPVTNAYGMVTVTLQYPREKGIRPFLAASYLRTSAAHDEAAFAQLGLAWSAW